MSFSSLDVCDVAQRQHGVLSMRLRCRWCRALLLGYIIGLARDDV
ncbi:MAG: hypothetical protein AAF499_06180 [Pseudomonadota bacterium]